MTRRDVFVSYARPDRVAALDLVSWLESQRIECWVAPRDITPGTDWAAEIIDAIAAARAMVLVFSTNANMSPQVCREVERAINKGVSILPVRIENALPTRSLEYFLSTQHWLDAFPPPREPHYAKLCTYLRSILAADAADEPAAQARPTASTHADRTLAGAHFDEIQLRRLEAQLARYVGPLAKHLVRRATSRASRIDELVIKLGGEIESEADRRQFIEACMTSAWFVSVPEGRAREER